MTRLLAYLGEASASLWRNRTRSILTVLGMIIGTWSIVAIFGLSRGAASGIETTLLSTGSDPVTISVDDSQNYPQYAQIQYRDATTVREALGTRAKYVMPFYFRSWKVVAGNTNAVEQIVAGGFDDSTYAMQAGRRIDQTDVDEAANVCTITSDVAEKFFHGGPAVGGMLRVNGTPCTVVGVYPKLNGSFINSFAGSNAVIVPYSTFHQMAPGPVDQLQIFPANPNDADAIGKAAKAVLQHIHGTTAKYDVINSAAFVHGFETTLSVLGVGLSGIGAIALLVAGIGIMNIMLVSVTERTREIGIRKSIGASSGDIVLQFLMEAVLLSLAGGAIGLLLGVLTAVGGGALIASFVGTVAIPYGTILSIAILFSIVIGVLFGLYPAIRAARLDPVEALRS